MNDNTTPTNGNGGNGNGGNGNGAPPLSAQVNVNSPNNSPA